MKYAVFTVCMPEFTVEEAIDRLAEWGYDGVEWRVVNQRPSADGKPGYWSGNRCTISEDELPDVAEDLGRRCRDAGLEICSLGTYLRCHQLDAIERTFRAAGAMGAPQARVGVPGYDGSVNYRELFEQALTDYAKVEKLARTYGVKAVVETHHGSILPSASAAYRFAGHFDPECVGVIHDAGNMVHEGFENYRFGFELLGEYLAEVHVKNTAWEQTNETGPNAQRLWQASWCEMKDGIVNWADVMRALKAVGYDGWLALEDFSTDRPTEQKLPDAVKYLRELEASA